MNVNNFLLANSILLPENLYPLLLVTGLWDAVWKGFAMWKAARNGSKVWFILLMVINSIGILPIIYLLLNRSKPQEPKL